MINVRLAVRSDWQQNATLVAEKAQVERELGGDGRVLIRASGTEPVLRVMVEARDAARRAGASPSGSPRPPRPHDSPVTVAAGGCHNRSRGRSPAPASR